MVPLFFQTPKGGCSTLILDTLSVLPMFSDGQMKPINYMDVVPPTTVAHLVCKPGYKRPRSDLFKDKINCLANGQWDHHVALCDPVCGEITIGVPFHEERSQLFRMCRGMWGSTRSKGKRTFRFVVARSSVRR